MGLYRPLELKLDLLRIVVQLMLDGELGALRNSNPHARDLDPERLVLLQSVCEAAKLGHHVLSGVDPFDISRTPGHGDSSFARGSLTKSGSVPWSAFYMSLCQSSTRLDRWFSAARSHVRSV